MPCVDAPPVHGCPGPIVPAPKPDTRCTHCKLVALTENAIPVGPPPPMIGFPQAQTIPSTRSPTMTSETRERLATLTTSAPDSPEDFVIKLVDAATLCRAGSRVLQVTNEGKDSVSAALWRAVGLGDIVDDDTRNVKFLYATLGQLLVCMQRGNMASSFKVVLATPVECALQGAGFEKWATAALGNCAETASADCLVWAEAICSRSHLDFRRFQPAISSAKAIGKREEDEFAKRRFEYDRRSGQIKVPDLAAYMRNGKDPFNKFLKDIVSMNKEKPHALVKKAWDRERDNIIALFLAEDEDLIEWEQARRS